MAKAKVVKTAVAYSTKTGKNVTTGYAERNPNVTTTFYLDLAWAKKHKADLLDDKGVPKNLEAARAALLAYNEYLNKVQARTAKAAATRAAKKAATKKVAVKKAVKKAAKKVAKTVAAKKRAAARPTPLI